MTAVSAFSINYKTKASKRLDKFISFYWRRRASETKSQQLFVSEPSLPAGRQGAKKGVPMKSGLRD